MPRERALFRAWVSEKGPIRDSEGEAREGENQEAVESQAAGVILDGAVSKHGT